MSPVYGAGVQILEFGPVYQYISSGETVDFQVKFQNIGDQDVDEITAKPFLLSWDNFDDDKNFNNPLPRPNPEINRIGGIGVITWDDVQVPEGITKQENFKYGVRLYYDYSTQTTATVSALSSQAYAGYMERGETPPTVSSVSNSMGPIQVEVLMDNVFITNAADSEVPITLKFRNVGNGYPQEPSASPREFSISGVDIEEVGNSGIGGVDTSDCDNVRMKSANEGSCTVYVDVPDIGDDILEIRLRITTEYSYVTEDTKSVVVHPELGG